MSKPAVLRPSGNTEIPTPERCLILEVSNSDADQDLSVARARVEPGVTTQLHRLDGTDERYLITSGHGRVEVGDLEPIDVASGDIVLIPDGATQRITNTGSSDLVFYCICTPRFSPEMYVSLEDR